MAQGAEPSGLKLQALKDQPLIAMDVDDMLTGVGCSVVGPAAADLVRGSVTAQIVIAQL
jgi:hypothetical protein